MAVALKFDLDGTVFALVKEVGRLEAWVHRMVIR